VASVKSLETSHCREAAVKSNGVCAKTRVNISMETTQKSEGIED